MLQRLALGALLVCARSVPTEPSHPTLQHDEAHVPHREPRLVRNHRVIRHVIQTLQQQQPQMLQNLTAHADCFSRPSWVCASQLPDLDFDYLYNEMRRVAQSFPFVQYLLDNCRSGFLAMATRDCSPANNLTGGQGMVVLSDASTGHIFGADAKIDAAFCGSRAETPAGAVPWGKIRQDGRNLPPFDGCHTAPEEAYSSSGPCGQFAPRDYVLAAYELSNQYSFDPRSGGIGLTSETVRSVLANSTGGASIGLLPYVDFPYSLLHRAAMQTAFECLGGWYGCEMFMCQHCPGCCNSDLPGGYEWTSTPSSLDGSLVWEQMYVSTPRHFVDGTDLLQTPV